jgi:hypothetical protein
VTLEELRAFRPQNNEIARRRGIGDAEDLILAHAPRFIRLREEGRADLRKGKTVSWEPLKTKVRELKSDR